MTAFSFPDLDLAAYLRRGEHRPRAGQPAGRIPVGRPRPARHYAPVTGRERLALRVLATIGAIIAVLLFLGSMQLGNPPEVVGAIGLAAGAIVPGRRSKVGDGTEPEPLTPPVLVTIGFDYKSGGYQVDEDGEPIAHTTVGDLIVEAATAQLVRELRGELTKKILAETTAAIRAQVTDVIAETMAAPIRKTNMWGEPEGTATSLRSLIGEQVQTFMKATSSSYGRADDNAFQKLVRAEVYSAMDKELKETIAAARKQVEGAVKDKAAQLIADAVKVAGR